MKWLGLLLLLAACNTGLHRVDYTDTCNVDSDCVAVFMGDPCNGCSCTNDAISTSSKAKYDADARAYASFCSPFRPQCLADCVAARAVCQAGRCALSTSP
ncbi:MAG: hypothetical protein GQE15_15030 [Archangiaceae bacterium]|nr:hypothetical protein [Archangiaceae bacterium]